MSWTALEVRCCCTPEKLIGWLQVRESQVYHGARVRFFVAPARSFRELGVPSVSGFEASLIELPISEINVDGDRYLAVKGEETPIEILRRIQGFQENRR